MAHHSLRKAVGSWIGVFTSGDLEFFDAMQYASIDGDSGGTWSPTAWIMLGGDYGLRIGSTAALQCDGNVTLGTSNSNTLTCNSAAHFYAAVRVHSAGINADGDIVNAGNTDFGYAGSTHQFRGVSTFYGSATFGESTTSATVRFNTDVTFAANTNIGESTSDTLAVRASSTIYHLTVINDSQIGSGGVSLGNDTLTLNSKLEAYSLAEFNASLTALAGLNVTNSPITFGDGGYIQRRAVFSSASAPVVSVVNTDVLVASAATVVFLTAAGNVGACLDIVNANSSAISIQDAASGHVLRTLPANTTITLMRSGSAGSYGWQSLGERTYVALV